MTRKTLPYSEDCDCSTQTPDDSYAEQCGSSARVPQIFHGHGFHAGGHGFSVQAGMDLTTDVDSVQADTDFLCGRARIFHADGHGSFVQIRVENGRNQKANFVRNNAEGLRNTSHGS